MGTFLLVARVFDHFLWKRKRVSQRGRGGEKDYFEQQLILCDSLNGLQEVGIQGQTMPERLLSFLELNAEVSVMMERRLTAKKACPAQNCSQTCSDCDLFST